MYQGKDLLLMGLKICNRCIYDESIPGIEFDKNGICNYCRLIEELKDQFGTGNERGEKTLYQIVDRIKKSGKGRKYDCIVGVSGGTDSSYVLAKAVELGLKPLAVHWDNTWDSGIATENIRKITTKLNVDLYTYVVDNKEMDDIYRSFFFSGVPELDCATDIALVEVIYRAASKYKLKYVLEGHSFMAEGISPLGNTYFDGGYIHDIHKKFGKTKMKTFPNMTFWKFLYWILWKRIKKIRPLWYLQYSKEEAREYLSDEFGWQYYGGHHLENRIAAFSHSYYMPMKFGIDLRNNSLSASIRNKMITREDALVEYSQPPFIEDDLIGYFRKRLEIDQEDFEKIMKGEKKDYRDYETYKKRFEKLRPLFYILAKGNLVTMSFYHKYTSRNSM